MIVRSGQPFTLHDLFRFSLTTIQRRVSRSRGPRLDRRRRAFAPPRIWSLLSELAARSAVLLHDRSEPFYRFCPSCGEDTMHEGFDELGVGWYAQISRCQRCGRQGMRVCSLV